MKSSVESFHRVIRSSYAMPPMVRQLSRFDLFGFIPVPVHHGGRRFGGYLSLVATICMATAVIAYATTSVNRFLYDNVSVAITTAFSNDPLTATLPGVTFTLPSIADPRYFTMTLEARSKQLTSTTSIKRPVTPSVVGTTTLVVQNASVPLVGNCLLQDCAYFRVKIFPCTNSTASTPSCASNEDVDLLLQNNYFRVSLNLTDGPQPLRFVRDISLSLSFSSKMEFYLDKKMVVSKADLLTNFEPETTTSLTNGQMVYTIDRLPRQQTDNTELAKIDIGLSGVLITETRNKQTSLDLIGQIFAFFGALVAIGQQMFTRLNKYAFYHHFPGWANVSDRPFGNAASTAEDGERGEGVELDQRTSTYFVPIPNAGTSGDDDGTIALLNAAPSTHRQAVEEAKPQPSSPSQAPMKELF